MRRTTFYASLISKGGALEVGEVLAHAEEMVGPGGGGSVRHITLLIGWFKATN